MNTFRKNYNGVEIDMYFTKYIGGKNLALVSNTTDGAPYAVFTVNIEPLPQCLGAVDTNNLDGVDEWLVKEGIATYTDMVLPSGFCMYPVMMFNKELIENFSR